MLDADNLGHALVYASGATRPVVFPFIIAKEKFGIVVAPAYLGNLAQSRAFTRLNGLPSESLLIVSAVASSAPSGITISAIFSHVSPPAASTASHAVGFPSVSTALTLMVWSTVAPVMPREISPPPDGISLTALAIPAGKLRGAVVPPFSRIASATAVMLSPCTKYSDT